MGNFDNEVKEMNYLKDYINSPFAGGLDPETGNVTNDYLTNENTYKTKEDEYKNLTGILNVRKKMLEVNLERNDVKNKIIYTLFSLIMIIIIITISIHSNFKK